MPMPNRLLIVHDEEDISRYLANAARRCGYFATVASSYDDFVLKSAEIDPSVILLDQSMPGINAIEYLKALNAQGSAASIVIVGAVDDRAVRTVNQLGQILELKLAESLSNPYSVNAFRRILRRLAVTEDLIDATEVRAALVAGQIHPHYQPRASSRGGGQWKITGVQAIAHWHRGESDIRLPGNIPGVVEDDPLLADLTDALVRQVAEHLSDWSQQGRDLDASVSLNSTVLTDRKMPDRLQRIMRKAGVDNSRMTLQVSELDSFDHSAEAFEVLGRLHVKGFRLSIDDFGAGYSSLEQLYRMPFSELKIDPSFVTACEMSHEARAIVEAAILLGHKLGLDVCAQGVENRKSFDYLKEQGCDSQQGYYLGRMVPAEELLPVVLAWNATGSKTTAKIAGGDRNIQH